MLQETQFSSYIERHWNPRKTEYERQAQYHRRAHLLVSGLTVAAIVGGFVMRELNLTSLQLSLYGLALIGLTLHWLYDFRARARHYQGTVAALVHEHDLFTRKQGVYKGAANPVALFERRCDAIIESGSTIGYRLTLIQVEEDAKPATESRPPSNPFGTRPSSFGSSFGSGSTSASSSSSSGSAPSGGSLLGNLRNRFGSNPPEKSSSDDELEYEDLDDDDDNDSTDSKRPPSSSGSLFGSRPSSGSGTSSSGTNPFTRPSGSPFGGGNRPPSGSSPFGSGSRFSGNRPIASSGGMRREGTDDPALVGIEGGNSRTGVRFVAYYHKELALNDWHPLKAYALMGYAMDAVNLDAEGGDAEKLPEILYDRNRSQSRFHIPEGTLVTVTPHMKGFQFNPPNVSIGFYRTWHRFDFEMRAVGARQDEATNGYLTFSLDGLVVADVPMSVYVGQGLGKDRKDITRKVSRKPYRAVYPSFADKDVHLAERFRRIFDALGMYNMRDVMQARISEGWSADLAKAIDEAEVFQLFWSDAAANAASVSEEVQRAVARSSTPEQFIRAVYWEQPPAVLPEPISNLKLDYLPEITGQK